MDNAYSFYSDGRFKDISAVPFDPVKGTLAEINPKVATLKPVPKHDPKKETPYWVNGEWVLRAFSGEDQTQTEEYAAMMARILNSINDKRLERESVLDINGKRLPSTPNDLVRVREQIAYMRESNEETSIFRGLDAWHVVTIKDLESILKEMQRHIFEGMKIQKLYEDHIGRIKTIEELKKFDR